MLQRYLETVSQARAQRRLAPPPGVRVARLVGGAAVALVGYIGASILLVPPSEEPAFNFVDERGAVTALSATFLAAGAGLALATCLVGAWPEKHLRRFWLVLALAIGFFALDELLQFHERLGDNLESVGSLDGIVTHTPLRNLNDLIVILYGVLAVPVGLLFLPGVLRTPYVFPLLIAACACYAIHTAIDSAFEPPTYLSIICEESAKLYSACLIALAMLVGLLGTVAERCRDTHPSDTKAPPTV